MKCLLFMVLFLPVVYSQSQVNSDRCGKGSLSCEFPTGRISGGKDTCSEMQPWHALIKFQRKSHLKCGGVLITEQHVLSAAHCYWSNGDNCPAKFHSFTLEQCRDDKHCPHYDCRRFGEHDILVYLGVTDSTELGYGEVRTLKKLDLHQGWVKETQLNGILQGNDLALLTLRSRVDTACTHIMPICLPLQPSVIGKMAYVVGFGLQSRLIQPTTRLQKAEVQIMECENRAGNKKWPISGNQLCALGEETDKTIIGDTCKGDSGGGLFCFDAVNNRNYLLGITSFGEDLCGITDSRPGVYTNVYDHKDWIEAMIKENGSDNKCALRSGPDMPPQEPVAVKTTVILLGGKIGGKTESYPCDVAIGDIGELYGLGAAVLNGQIVYCGGYDGECHRNCFKNEGMDWIEFESMNVARSGFTLTTLGDKILAAGGKTGQEKTATVEVFDGSSWKLQNYELTSGRSYHCAVPISESQVMLLGGSTYTSLSLVEVYSIEEGFIVELPSMPTARFGLACSMFKGEIWTAGGFNAEDVDVVEIFNPFTDTWRSGPTLTKRGYFLTIEVLDNNLVVFGGWRGNDNLLILEGEDWREEPLQYRHFGHASVSIPCN